jgi:rubrerythrin
VIGRQAGAALVELASRAVDDEQRHAALSLEVASRYAQKELRAPAPLVLEVPKHAKADPGLRQTLHILGHCTMNETIASAFLEAAYDAATAPLPRAALRELLSDEIDHARIGWAHLASLSAEERRAVQPWLPGMLVANLQMWRETPRGHVSDPELARVLAGHGAPARNQVESMTETAVRDLIEPGYARFGLRVRG